MQLQTLGVSKSLELEKKLNHGCQKNKLTYYVYKKQETIKNIRETRRSYTWFFSGEGGRKEHTGGVAIVVHNSYLQYIEDIEPITDRIMYITLRGAMPTTIITVYMSAADRPYEEKSETYDNYRTQLTRKKQKDHYIY